MDITLYLIGVLTGVVGYHFLFNTSPSEVKESPKPKVSHLIEIISDKSGKIVALIINGKILETDQYNLYSFDIRDTIIAFLNIKTDSDFSSYCPLASKIENSVISKLDIVFEEKNQLFTIKYFVKDP